MDVFAGEYTAAGFAPSDAIRGTSELAAPFIIAGGTYFMTAGSADGSSVITTSLGSSYTLSLPADMPPMTEGVCILATSLSAMTDEYGSVALPLSLGAEGSVDFESVTGQNLKGNFVFTNTLGDFGFTGACGIDAHLPLTGFSGSLAFRNPSRTASVSADTFTVSTDGRDRTDRLVSLNISLFGVPSARAVFKTEIRNVKNFSAVINGTEFIFEITSISVADGKTELTGKTAQPAELISADTIKRASEAVSTLSDKIIWAASDFVADIQGTFTPMTLAQYLADNAGLKIRLLPNGYVVVSDGGSDITLEPESVFSRTFARNEQKYKTITVNYGSSIQNHVHIEAPSQSNTGSAIQVRLYHCGKSTLAGDSDNLKLIRRNITEIITEEVLFRNGEGTLKVPARNLITQGLTADGKAVSCCNLNGYRTVSYTTTYDLYEITETAETKRFVTAVSDSSVVLVLPQGSGNLTVSAPALCDRVSAMLLAEKLTTADKITMETTHLNGLTTAAGLMVKSPFGSGRVTAAQITLSGSPLRVKNIIEVQP
jgi:hypothetical protein